MFHREFQGDIIRHLLRCPELAAERENVNGADFWKPVHQTIFYASQTIDGVSGTTVPIPQDALMVALRARPRNGTILREDVEPLDELLLSTPQRAPAW